jgi:hypothetical protein
MNPITWVLIQQGGCAGSRLDRSLRHPVAFGQITLDRLPMNRTTLKLLSILLILCIISIGGLAQAQSVEHAGHHAQHQAATHGTLLCSWMCAAGVVLDTAVVTFQAELSPITFVTLSQFTQPSIEACRTSTSRAPPSFSL